MNPCSTEKPREAEWGCREFVGIKGYVVDKNTQLEDYDRIVKGTDQQQLPNLARQKNQGGKAKRVEQEKPNAHVLVFEV